MASIHYWWPKFEASVQNETTALVTVTESPLGILLTTHMTFHTTSAAEAEIIADGFNEIAAKLDALAQAHAKDAA